MKILQVFPFFSIEFGGGTVDVIYKQSKALNKKGHDVEIFTSNYKFDKPYADSLKNVKVHAFYSIVNHFGLNVMPGMIREAVKNLKDFEIIHMHCYRNFQNVIIRYYAKKNKVPYVIDAHGSTPRGNGKVFIKWIFDILFGYRLLKDAAKCVAETEVGVNEYREIGVNPDKIILLPPPFDTEEFSMLPSKGLFRGKYDLGDKKIIMFLGRINWIKGIDFLTEGFNVFLRTRGTDDAVLVIVGPDDGFKSQLLELISELKLQEKVIFAGFLTGNEKLSALVDADVVVQTSRYEQGAWAPIEAVLCGTPIIVSDNSGAGEDVKKIDAGYLVKFGDITDLSNQIKFVLENKEKALHKTEKAKDYIINNMSIDSKINDYISLYFECIDSGEKMLNTSY